MVLHMMHTARCLVSQNELPDHILERVLRVYEFGDVSDIKCLPNELICLRSGDLWTTWSEVFRIRKRLQKEKRDNSWSISKINAEQRKNPFPWRMHR